jgi:hypothetical protein
VVRTALSGYRKYKFLYLLTAVTVLHFCTKETSFIYVAQALLFLHCISLPPDAPRVKQPKISHNLIVTLILSIIVLAAGAVLKMLAGKMTLSDVTLPQYPAIASWPSFLYIALIIIGVLGLVAAVYSAIAGFGLNRIRQERVFDLLMLIGTLVLPQLSAFGINAFGWKIPVNATEVRALTMTDMLHMAIIVVPIIIVSILLGRWWNRRQWLINAGIWYAIYIVLYQHVQMVLVSSPVWLVRWVIG